MRMNLIAILAIGTVGTAHAANEPTDAQKRKTATSQYYVDTAVETKQVAVPAESGNYVVTYPNSAGNDTNHDEAGEINKRHISTTLTVGNNGGDGVNAAGADIPTVGAVNSGLNGKQAKLSNTAGKLVTYGDSEGSVGTEDVYNESNAYSGQSTALVRASHVNAAVANGFAALLTCQDYETGYNATNDPNGDHCLTYRVNTLNGTYVPQGN